MSEAGPEPEEGEGNRLRVCSLCDGLELNGEPLEGGCTCGETTAADSLTEARWWPLIAVPDDLPTFDPKTGIRNVYAQRIMTRFAGDLFYLRKLAETRNGDTAALSTCEKMGHDVRAGICNRCGARVPRSYYGEE